MKSEQNAIMQLIADYQKAIHTADEKNFRSLWTCEPSNVLISITQEFKGIDDIYHGFLLEKIHGKYSRIELLVESVEYEKLQEDIAIIVFRYRTECVLRENDEPYSIEGLETQIVKLVEGQWKLAHIHYSK